MAATAVPTFTSMNPIWPIAVSIPESVPAMALTDSWSVSMAIAKSAIPAPSEDASYYELLGVDDEADLEAPSEDASYYELLGVDDEADLEALTVAYRQRALAEHPDKGGDAARFHEIARAFKVLSDPEARREYDEKLAKAEERAQLVEGGPAKGAAGMSAKQAQAPMARQKTAPMPGSKRQAKMRCGQPGNYNACAEEWKNMGSAFRVLMAITDDVTPEQKTEELMDKYAALPRGKDKKREWVNGLRGKDKQDFLFSSAIASGSPDYGRRDTRT
ncbi:unnamed protein product [Prorocentrum cordatum]|uniref:J domain-containing protein n=1 Tax=Prorocentrum cordatum TaxID=2364126 RepID=A0ABN9VXQ8_9DINO|nr:unnamed protein product [Polarella glacialis]